MLNQDKFLLEIKNLSKTFRKAVNIFSKAQQVDALKNISIGIEPGEVLGVVGESGSGKSTLAKLVAGLEAPDSGEIFYKGQKLDWKKVKRTDAVRTEIQMVFQNPYASFNPRMKIGTAVSEPLLARRISKQQALGKAYEALEQVGLDKAVADKFPPELSGGMLQRIAIARALIIDPKILICDEPVSALDVSVCGQILNLLKELNKKFALTMIFISHDLAVTRFIADSVAVIYEGQIVEHAATAVLFKNATHKYTKFLLKAAGYGIKSKSR